MATANRERTVCETCELPFYADRANCPYCDAAGDHAGGTTDEESGFVFGTAEATGRSRTRCPDCGLPYYEHEDGCPYCAAAADAAAPSSTGEVSEDVSSDHPDAAEPADSAGVEPATGDDAGGIFGRIKRALGL